MRDLLVRLSRTRSFRFVVVVFLVATCARLWAQVAAEKQLDVDKDVAVEVERAPRNVAPAQATKPATVVTTPVSVSLPAAPADVAPSTGKAIPFDGGEGKTIVTIDIFDTIDLGLAPFVDRVVEEANEEDDVVAIVIEVNTPGGRVDAAVTIKDALLKSKKPTIAWINTQAISAGALITYACDFILMNEGGTMGAATPITLGGQGQAQPVEEKFVSYMRGVMRATAEAKGRSGDVAESMVDASIEVPGVSEAGKLLTLTTAEALEAKVADFKATSMDEVLTIMKLTGAKIETHEVNWAEEIARILTDPVVSSLLMTFGFLGIVIEMYTPGFGLPGIVGITSLVIFFVGHLVVHLAGIEEVLLFVAGIVLIVIEVFVTPGFGVLGIAGIMAIVVSLVLALIALPIDVSYDTGHLGEALFKVSLAVVLTALVATLFFKFFPKTSPGSRLILSHELTKESGCVASDLDKLPLQGKRGVARTYLRPVGVALIEGDKYDVVAEGEFVPKDTPLVVTRVEGLKIVVRAVSPSDETETSA